MTTIFMFNFAIGGDWHGINPVTKIMPDKRRKKDKYKKGYDEDNNF